MVSSRRGKQYNGHNPRQQAKAPAEATGRERGRGPGTAKRGRGKRRKRRPPARPRAAETRRPRRGWPRRTAGRKPSGSKKTISPLQGEIGFLLMRSRRKAAEPNRRPVVWAPVSGKETGVAGLRSLPRDGRRPARRPARDAASAARSVQKRSKNLRKNLRKMQMRIVRMLCNMGGWVGNKNRTE